MKKLAICCALLMSMTSFMTACAARQKTQIVQISTVGSKSTNTMKSVKCAIQQAGWNITYSDSESVSATKASGMDNVPITLNIRLEGQNNNTTKAIFTVGSPRGVYGNGDYYSRDVVNALQNCGARGLVVDELNKQSVYNKPASEDQPKVIKETPVTAPIAAPVTITASQPVAQPVEKKSESSVAHRNTPPSSASMVVINSKAKLRKSPSTKATVIKTLKKGEEVQVIKLKDEWCLVELAGGETGWCQKSSLSQMN